MSAPPPSSHIVIGGQVPQSRSSPPQLSGAVPQFCPRGHDGVQPIVVVVVLVVVVVVVVIGAAGHPDLQPEVPRHLLSQPASSPLHRERHMASSDGVPEQRPMQLDRPAAHPATHDTQKAPLQHSPTSQALFVSHGVPSC